MRQIFPYSALRLRYYNYTRLKLLQISQRNKGRDLTQSYGKSSFTKAHKRQQHNEATKNFDITTIAEFNLLIQRPLPGKREK